MSGLNVGYGMGSRVTFIGPRFTEANIESLQIKQSKATIVRDSRSNNGFSRPYPGTGTTLICLDENRFEGNVPVNSYRIYITPVYYTNRDVYKRQRLR